MRSVKLFLNGSNASLQQNSQSSPRKEKKKRLAVPMCLIECLVWVLFRKGRREEYLELRERVWRDDGSWYNGKLHSLYSSSNIIRRMRWVGHVARIGKLRNAYQLFVLKNLKDADDMRDIDVYWRIILRLILDKYSVRVAKGLIWLRIVFNGGFLWTRKGTSMFCNKGIFLHALCVSQNVMCCALSQSACCLDALAPTARVQ